MEKLELLSSEQITETKEFSVKELVQMEQVKRLNLRPEFQRRKVWPKNAKSYLVDTVLRGLPVPEIFSYRERNGTLAVIDGQQRLTTIIDFANNNLHAWTGGKIVTIEDLEQPQRDTFLSYKVVFRVINSFDLFFVRDIFLRMNRYVVPLNGQEMRHAKAEAKIVKLAEEYSVDAFWRTSGLVNATGSSRMKDVEFIIRLFLAMKNGVGTAGRKEVDRAIAAIDAEDIPTILDGYTKTLELAKKIFGPVWQFANRFGQREFYCFFIALHNLVGVKITEGEAAKIREAAFDLKQEAMSKNPSGLALRYFRACYGGGVTLAQERCEIFLDLIKKNLRH
ncbi:MAG: DUF262 domain-containing protein [Nitrososphaerota archaeon]|nr:DUF262 domain-containing protein [Nitrososphaerota archaeon]